MNCYPSSFCTICTSPCKTTLNLLLQSIQIHHKDIPIHICCDEKTKIYLTNNTNLFPDLNITYYIELDEWTDYSRDKMTKEKCFGKFLENKMRIMLKALEIYRDTLFLDTDILFLSKIKDIDHTKDVGLSPQYLNETAINRTGKYNAGFIWTKSKDLCNYWISIIDNNRKCPEQINMHLICDKFNYFEFKDNYNIQPSRFMAGIYSSKKKMKSFVTKNNDNKICYNGKEIVCIHTHFCASYTKEINDFLLCKLIECNTYHKEVNMINDFKEKLKKNNYLVE